MFERSNITLSPSKVTIMFYYGGTHNKGRCRANQGEYPIGYYPSMLKCTAQKFPTENLPLARHQPLF